MLDSILREKAWNADVTRALGIWLTAAAAAVAISSAGVGDAAVVASVGGLAVLANRQWILVACFAAAAALDVAVLPWAIAAAAVVHATRETRVVAPRLD